MMRMRASVASPTPAAGPIAAAAKRRPASQPASSPSGGKARSMMAVTWAACSRSATGSPAMVTAPAPALRAEAAASREAPVESSGPLMTRAWPRRYLCASGEGVGTAARQSAGALTQSPSSVRGAWVSSMPMSAQVTSPHSARPGQSRWPGFNPKKVTLWSASTTGPVGWPLSPDSPEGRSTATTTAGEAFSRAIAPASSPSTGA